MYTVELTDKERALLLITADYMILNIGVTDYEQELRELHTKLREAKPVLTNAGGVAGSE